MVAPADPLPPQPLYDPALDAHVAEMQEIAAAMQVGGDDGPLTMEAVSAARELIDALTTAPETVQQRFETRSIPGPRGPLELRVHMPEGPVRAVTLDLHGGGFFIGRPAMNDRANLRYAEATGSATVSSVYGLGPEDPFPAGVDDCEAAALWLLQHAEAEFGAPLRVIGGQSSGANLAVLAMLRLRDRHDALGGILAANLVFGVYDLSLTPSQVRLGSTGFRDLYLPGVPVPERNDPAISPLYADLTALPPALFTVGTTDYLYDDSLFMAARWRAAGNPADLGIYPACPHGFTGYPAELARIANRACDEWVAGRLDAGVN